MSTKDESSGGTAVFREIAACVLCFCALPCVLLALYGIGWPLAFWVLAWLLLTLSPPLSRPVDPRASAGSPLCSADKPGWVGVLDRYRFFSARVRRAFARVRNSLGYLRDWYRTPAAEQWGLTRPKPWKMPICWVAGHRHADAYVCSWRLCFCQRCGEETAWRTSWKQIEYRPADAGYPCDDDFDFDLDVGGLR